MIKVGVRELKAHLSYYLRLMQEGEEIAICLREQVIGYLSALRQAREKKTAKRRASRSMQQLMEAWRKEGFLLSGGKPGRYRECKPVKMTPGPSTTEMIRKMRDEEWG